MLKVVQIDMEEYAVTYKGRIIRDGFYSAEEAEEWLCAYEIDEL